LILTFAESQLASKGLFDDVIEGKGKGIIMLLTGEPGVGKTLTAESRKFIHTTRWEAILTPSSCRKNETTSVYN
jgi:hypothetical protein